MNSFIRKISGLFLRIKDFHEQTRGSLVDNILKAREKQIISLGDSDILINILINDIWRFYYPSHKDGEVYNIDIESLSKRSYKEFKELLKHDGKIMIKG